MKYLIVKTKAGWIVQNTTTMSVTSIHKSEAEALRVAKVLNGHK